jgi:hypothetical protein
LRARVIERVRAQVANGRRDGLHRNKRKTRTARATGTATAQVTVRTYSTVKVTECQPVAPSGTGSRRAWSWVYPDLSVARHSTV